MTTFAVPQLLQDAAARLPTDGKGRAVLMDLYQRRHEPEDLEALSPIDFLHMHRRAREEWDNRQAVKIAEILTRYTTNRKTER